MPHVADGIIHAYLDGALAALGDAGELPDGMSPDDVVAHLRACADCGARLEAERDVRERAGLVLLDAAPSQVDAPPFAALERTRRTRARSGLPLAWAASVLVAVGAGWWGSVVWRSELPQNLRTVQSEAMLEMVADPDVTTRDRTTPDAMARPAAPAPETPVATPQSADAGPTADMPPIRSERSVPAAGELRADRARVASPSAPLAAVAQQRDSMVRPTPLGSPERRSAEIVIAPTTFDASPQTKQAETPPPPTELALFAFVDGRPLTRVITPGPEMFRFEAALDREQSGMLLWEVADPDDANIADLLFVMHDGSEPTIERAREIGRTTVRVRQTLATGESVEVITWREEKIALSEIVVTGVVSASARAAAAAAPARADTADREPDPLPLAKSATKPRVLDDGRHEIILQDTQSGTWIALRAHLPPEALNALADRLTKPDTGER